jgi:hypothetical protein
MCLPVGLLYEVDAELINKYRYNVLFYSKLYVSFGLFTSQHYSVLRFSRQQTLHGRE